MDNEIIGPTEYLRTEMLGRLAGYIVSIRARFGPRTALHVRLPVFLSDHKQVTLHVKTTGRRRRQRSTVKLLRYPIRSATPDRVPADVIHDLVRTEVGSHVTSGDWDTAVSNCKSGIKQIKKRESHRARRMRYRI